MNQYSKLQEAHALALQKLTKQFNLIRLLRFALVACIIFAFVKEAFQHGGTPYLIAGILATILFFILVKKHDKINWDKKITETLIDINQTEIRYVHNGEIPFYNGKDYVDSSHLYSYDLDVFGEHSLYQNLNRTATYVGRKSLAERLVTLSDQDEIKANQLAIKELSSKIEWRQYIYAVGKVVEDNRDDYTRLMHWAQQERKQIPKFVMALANLLPIAFVLVSAAYFILGNDIYSSIASFLFLMNLAVLMSQMGNIKQEIIDSDKTTEILKKYGTIIESIEEEALESPKLQALKARFRTGEVAASTSINKLSGMLSELQNVMNPFGAILFNGAFLYHIHTLNRILKWKAAHSADVELWLETIGEIEALNSLANLYFNNPNFIFPTLNQGYRIETKDLGHPLIPTEKRVCNDLNMHKNSFVILTGSNMSGKSTYLRTLGLNMILAGTGSAICASKANLMPLPVLVSMRQTDSLSDGESYFFAEVKRLKQLLNEIESKTCFVLLDEILRGTNSDDKRNGTIEVIKKIIAQDAIGVIATHDLEVCQTTAEYPDILQNKCFEGVIRNNELFFDYKLRDGICQSKTATFLLKKEEVI